MTRRYLELTTAHMPSDAPDFGDTQVVEHDIAECVRRGFTPKHRTPPVPVPGLDDDWTPTAEALALNRARIAERIAARPDFYRFTA